MKQVRPPKAQAVLTLLNAQAKGLTKRFFSKALPHWREVPGNRSTASTEGATRRTIGFWLMFPANLSGKADSEGKRHSKCCGFSLPLEFL
jgi:hypothetical protein